MILLGEEGSGGGSLSVGESMKKRFFDGIPFYLYREVEDRKEAEEIAENLRRRGWYARVISTGKKVKVYVSTNPRWFFEFLKI